MDFLQIPTSDLTTTPTINEWQAGLDKILPKCFCMNKLQYNNQFTAIRRLLTLDDQVGP